jgi:hypothetical protein
MVLHGRFRRGLLLRQCLPVVVMIWHGSAVAQDYPGPAPSRWIVSRPAVVCAQPVVPNLGTFEPTPYLMVRGNWPAGGGFSPLELYGDQSMAVYGPFSPLRATSAPIATYGRGYDGRVYARPATSFSTPNLPALSPVVYPKQANYYYAPRLNRTPPSWSSGFNWIDQQ